MRPQLHTTTPAGSALRPGSVYWWPNDAAAAFEPAAGWCAAAAGAIERIARHGPISIQVRHHLVRTLRRSDGRIVATVDPPATRLLGWRAYDRRGNEVGRGAEPEASLRRVWTLTGLDDYTTYAVDLLAVSGWGPIYGATQSVDIISAQPDTASKPSSWSPGATAVAHYSDNAGGYAMGYNGAVLRVTPAEDPTADDVVDVLAVETHRWGDDDTNTPTVWRPTRPPADLMSAARTITERVKANEAAPGRGAYRPMRDDHTSAAPMAMLTYGFGTTIKRYRSALLPEVR